MLGVSYRYWGPQGDWKPAGCQVDKAWKVSIAPELYHPAPSISWDAYPPLLKMLKHFILKNFKLKKFCRNGTISR